MLHEPLISEALHNESNYKRKARAFTTNALEIRYCMANNIVLFQFNHYNYKVVVLCKPNIHSSLIVNIILSKVLILVTSIFKCVKVDSKKIR